MRTIITEESAATVVKPEGRLDTIAAAEFDSQTEALRANPSKDITVDCDQLEYISSSGLRIFITMLKACKAAGKEMRLVNVSPQVKSVFDLTGLSPLFGIQ